MLTFLFFLFEWHLPNVLPLPIHSLEFRPSAQSLASFLTVQFPSVGMLNAPHRPFPFPPNCTHFYNKPKTFQFVFTWSMMMTAAIAIQLYFLYSNRVMKIKDGDNWAARWDTARGWCWLRFLGNWPLLCFVKSLIVPQLHSANRLRTSSSCCCILHHRSQVTTTL